MKKTKYLYLCTLITLLLSAQDTPNKWTLLPYAFSSESTGVSAGLGVIKQGLWQEQTTLVASLAGGLAQTAQVAQKEKNVHFSAAFIYFSKYLLPYTDRTFFSMMGLKSYFPEAKVYFDSSHHSTKESVSLSAGNMDFLHTNIKYILPLGSGKANPLPNYRFKDGLIISPTSTDRTPFITGRTTIGIKTFYEHDSYDSYPKVPLSQWNTQGLRAFLIHDNTDYVLNPSQGYHFELQYSKDFGTGSSTQSWDFLEFKYNHYLNVDTFSFTKQNVLAFSLWTGYSFSWDTEKSFLRGIAAHRPPPWEGARLGGFFKMRAYEQNRFSDKAALYATAEYRAILNYNPLKDNTLLPVPIEWFQVVAFIEAGRVHSAYNSTLLKNTKYDIGISLRALVAKLPIRFDVSYADEGIKAWLMINQPFDF
jgi:hypothetical protein